MSKERRHNPQSINLKVENIWLFSHSQGIAIDWSSDIGFGEYEIWFDDWTADSECMDCDEDKEFLAELLLKARDYILEKVKIVG